jgi:hypothetical protein
MMSGGREGGWGQNVLSRPSADSFAVGRRQKSYTPGKYAREKVSAGIPENVMLGMA